MPAPPSSVSPPVKRILATCALLISSAAAADVDPKLEKIVREALPVCAGGKVTFSDLPAKLPPRFKGTLVKVESENHQCDFQMGGIMAPSGAFYMGMPWTI